MSIEEDTSRGENHSDDDNNSTKQNDLSEHYNEDNEDMDMSSDINSANINLNDDTDKVLTLDRKGRVGKNRETPDREIVLESEIKN